jgi:hypothetical protein
MPSGKSAQSGAPPKLDWNNAAWHTIPAYHLTEEIVNEFLKSIFGYWDFYTSVSHLDASKGLLCLVFGQLQMDHYKFWIPRPLKPVRFGWLEGSEHPWKQLRLTIGVGGENEAA